MGFPAWGGEGEGVHPPPPYEGGGHGGTRQMRRICPQPPDALQQTLGRAWLILGVVRHRTCGLHVEAAARSETYSGRVPIPTPASAGVGRAHICVMRQYLERQEAPKGEANEEGAGIVEY